MSTGKRFRKRLPVVAENACGTAQRLRWLGVDILTLQLMGAESGGTRVFASLHQSFRAAVLLCLRTLLKHCWSGRCSAFRLLRTYEPQEPTF